MLLHLWKSRIVKWQNPIFQVEAILGIVVFLLCEQVFGLVRSKHLGGISLMLWKPPSLMQQEMSNLFGQMRTFSGKCQANQ
jgi:hypothetical protein